MDALEASVHPNLLHGVSQNVDNTHAHSLAHILSPTSVAHPPTHTVNVKWGKEKFTLDVDPSDPPETLKAQLFGLTSVRVPFIYSMQLVLYAC